MNPDALRFASVCSGIESASVAWEPLGMTPVWFSEIKPFPCKVLAHHWPHVHNWGDFTKIPAKAMTGCADILVGGTPCQAFSVAGKRESLNDDRGNLTLEFCRLADELDPHVVVWENVPGVLSTRDNAFGCFLAELCGNEQPALPTDPPTEMEINRNAKTPRVTGPKSKHWRWDDSQSAFVPKCPPYGAAIGPDRRVAWRILDAQYFGLAQRRRRVFVVASPRDHIDPSKILFEYEGVRRDTAPSRETGQKITNCITAGIGNSDRDAQCNNLVFALGLNGGAENAVHSVRPLNTQVITRHNKLGRGTGFGLGDHNSAQYTISASHHHAVGYGSHVRRVTPTECERLQGFPDGHTDIQDATPDGPRYEAIGNSKAVMVVRWLGQRIIKHLKGEL